MTAASMRLPTTFLRLDTTSGGNGCVLAVSGAQIATAAPMAERRLPRRSPARCLVSCGDVKSPPVDVVTSRTMGAVWRRAIQVPTKSAPISGLAALAGKQAEAHPPPIDRPSPECAVAPGGPSARRGRRSRRTIRANESQGPRRRRFRLGVRVSVPAVRSRYFAAGRTEVATDSV